MAEAWHNGTVIVTGGTGLIGQAISRAFLEADAKHVVCVGSTVRSTDQAARSFASYGGRFEAVAADVSDEGEVEKLFAAMESHSGPAHVLINGAGINHNRKIADISIAEFDRVIGVNLKAAFLVSRRACTAMIAAGIAGRVVNISSGNYRYVRPGSALYSATKAGLDMMTRAFAVEYGSAGIGVNSIAPGLVMNPDNDDAFFGEVVDYYEKMSPSGRASSAEDIARIAMFLASSGARAINGDIVVADGGFSAGRLDFPTRQKE